MLSSLELIALLKSLIFRTLPYNILLFNKDSPMSLRYF